MNLEESLEKIKEASQKLLMVDDGKISGILKKLADLLDGNSMKILEANQQDLSKLEKDDPIYDRVLLTEERIKEMAESLRVVSGYDSPIDIVLEERTLENGLELKKITVPLGVVAAIFEARPNVVIDVFALCFKSKNACVLKGGSQSEASNEFLFGLIEKALGDLSDAALLLPNDRELVGQIFKADKYIDVIIPRGSQKLIDFVRENSLVPVIETGAGVVHTYFDKDGDLEKGAEIVFNAKVDRPSVCNALDTLLVHKDRASDLLVLCGEKLAESKVEIYADEMSFEILDGHYPKLFKANEENFGKEYLSLKMSVKMVDDLEEAIKHINKYGSKHSEAIVTEDKAVADEFLKRVDAAAVYVNASTRFTDGGVFGLGAEIGISTQKLHARGPMGIKEITSYKWELRGDGQVR
jgi:glutamate-5-semialdehyde dehydrogenase